MSLEFITSPARWQQVYHQLPEFAGKIYYSYEYHAACAANHDGEPAAIFYTGSTTADIAEHKNSETMVALPPKNDRAEKCIGKILHNKNQAKPGDDETSDKMTCKNEVCDNVRCDKEVCINGVRDIFTCDNKTCADTVCRIFYPFLLKPIPHAVGGAGYFDLETAYGYGGPQPCNSNQNDLSNFRKLFSDWARQHNVVAEFIRFNPLTATQDQFADVYQIEHNRVTVSIDLKPEFSELLKGCTPARQRNWRHAQSAGLTMREMPDLAAFAPLYRQTMQRLDARPYYFFSDACFDAIEQLPEQSRFFAAACTPDNECAAAAIFLIDGQSAHYHLGASDPAFRDTQANAWLMLEFARKIATTGLKTLHLGGGLSLAEDDPLFRFKAGFSAVRHDFFIGRRVHQPEVYEALSQRWQALTGCQPKILLHYHYGANDENL